MIKGDLSSLEKESKEYLRVVTDNRAQNIKKEMIKFLKEAYWPDSSEYGLLMEFINDFFMKSSCEWDEDD